MVVVVVVWASWGHRNVTATSTSKIRPGVETSSSILFFKRRDILENYSPLFLDDSAGDFLKKTIVPQCHEGRRGPTPQPFSFQNPLVL